MAEFIKHIACPCGKSEDNLALYADGSAYCFTADCEKYWKDINALEEVEIGVTVHKTENDKINRWRLGKYGSIVDRGLDKNIVKKYGVRLIRNNDGTFNRLYPIYNLKGQTGYKERTQLSSGKKTYSIKSKTKGDWLLFGQNVFPAGGRKIVLTEGEEDAMSAYKMLGDKSTVVSLVNGASSVKKIFQNKVVYDYVHSFDEIILCFDNDEAGRKATNVAVSLLDISKIRIMKLENGYKDANDYLMAGKRSEFVSLFWKAEPFTLESITDLSSPEFEEELFSEKEVECYDYPWETLNEMTYGARLGELVTIIAETGVGKTQFFRELEYHFRNTTSHKIGIIHIEETEKNVAKGLLSLHMQAPVHLPKCDIPMADRRKAYQEIKDGFYVYSDFGSHNLEEIMNNIQFLVKVIGCKMIFFDHITMVVSDQRYQDERKALDELVTKLKTKTVEWDFNLHMISHTNREGDIRGTANIEKLSNIIIRLSRDIKNPDLEIRNTTSLLCEKNRFSGDTGPAGYLFYDKETCRMTETEEPTDQVL